MPNIKMCIQNLGKYNEGELLFYWLSLPATDEEIDKALDAIQICHTDRFGNEIFYGDEFGQPYEEMHMPDWECDFEGLEYSEWWSIDELNEIAERLDELSEYDLHWLEAYMIETNENLENAIDNYQDNSRYWEGCTLKEIAYEYADMTIGCISDKGIREFVEEFFDYDSYAESLDIREAGCGYIETF